MLDGARAASLFLPSDNVFNRLKQAAFFRTRDTGHSRSEIIRSSHGVDE